MRWKRSKRYKKERDFLKSVESQDSITPSFRTRLIPSFQAFAFAYINTTHYLLQTMSLYFILHFVTLQPPTQNMFLNEIL